MYTASRQHSLSPPPPPPPPGRYAITFKNKKFITHCTKYWLEHSLWYCSHVNSTEPHKLEINIASSSCFGPRQQAITWANVDTDLCRPMPSVRHNVLTWKSIAFNDNVSLLRKGVISLDKLIRICSKHAMHGETTYHHRPLQWRHNGCDGVSNHQPHDCLHNRLFRRRSTKTSKLRVTGLCTGK